ncbi:MAG: AAA family ATPase [Lachnospiraceae bacterium]|nr:AAA family ATPase [Lachnospiraceae bacterium]
MQKYFNITGICYPEKHYMVNLERRLKEIQKLIDRGDYFVINRARQYGKTTTLWALKQYLQKDYEVIFLSFQRLTQDDFKNEETFTLAFLDIFLQRLYRLKRLKDYDQNILSTLEQYTNNSKSSIRLRQMFHTISQLCETAPKPVVLIIDEVDSASNNQVFLDFLSILRDYYLDKEEANIFQSVILAGVYDIKNLRLKIRPEEEHKYNSPWNIAADFPIEMSFSILDITQMLQEYEKDHQTGMNTKDLATQIYNYTAGYPYMVSYLCKYLDDQSKKKENSTKKAIWTKEGLLEAVKDLVNRPNTLSDDMVKKLSDYPELKQIMKDILFCGAEYPYNLLNSTIRMAAMFGYIKERENHISVANRIMETQLYNFFLSEELVDSKSYKAATLVKNQFIKGNTLDMELILKKFTEHFTEIYGDQKENFLEENGRRFFLLYLKPIINGVGNYYIEAQTRNQKRTDIIIDYQGNQYIIEMKIWRGEEYNQRGEEQLTEYLEYYHLNKGYLLSFNFNKNKTTGIKKITHKGKTIIEAII